MNSLNQKIEKFPIRYDVHKYLGRKPWYVAKDIITEYTKRGDTVFDLFSGSGVTSFEAIRLGRNAVAVDHSQLSELLVRALCESCSSSAYKREAASLVSSIKRLNRLYYVQVNGKKGIMKYWIPSRNEGRVSFQDTGSTSTESLTESQFTDLKELLSFSWSHADEGLPYLRGSNVSKWRDIFTKRSQFVLQSALAYIAKVRDENVRRCLTLAVSASIEKISLLNSPKSGVTGWMRDEPMCYYKPDDFIEFNAVDAIENKVVKMESATAEANRLLRNSGKFVFLRERVENIRYRNAADLAIMDPPYLSEVPYDRLEALHDVWLGFRPEMQNIEHSFPQIVSKAFSALKERGTLVLLMLNYLRDSRDFFVRTIVENGFVQVMETRKNARKKEGLSITVFRKGVEPVRTPNEVLQNPAREWTNEGVGPKKPSVAAD